MKGFIKRSVMAACLTSGLLNLTGCYAFRDLVDPCYPWRYNWVAQQEVCEPLGIQVNNGHVLDQTVFSTHFDTGKAVLNAGGMDHLYTLVRRRPHPDPVIYLQMAEDVTYSPAQPPEVYAEARTKLNQARVDAIQKYLVAITAGRGECFQVLVHDPAQPYVRAAGMQRSMISNLGTYQGSLGAGGGGGGGGGGAP